MEPAASAHGASPPASYEPPFTLNPNSYNPQPQRLFRNRGDGTSEDATDRAGVATPTGAA